MGSRAASLLAGLGLVSLVTNRMPVVTLTCWSLAAAGGAVEMIRQSRRPERLHLWLAGVMGYWTASFVMSREAWGTFFSYEFHRRDGQIFFSLLPLAIGAALDPDRRLVMWSLGAFCAAQAGIALLGSVAVLTGCERSLCSFMFMIGEGSGEIRGAFFTAFYQAHNAAGSVLGLCCLAAFTLSVFLRVRRERWFWALIAVPLLWGVMISRSRGCLGALVASSAVVGFIGWSRRLISRRAAIGAALAIGFSAILFGAHLKVRARESFGKGLESEPRWGWWSRAVREWTWSPILGEGLGRFNDGDRQWSGIRYLYYAVTKAKAVNEPTHAHNSYLQFLAEGGVAGLIASVGLWILVALKLRKSEDPLRFAGFMGTLFLFLGSLTENYMGGGIMLLLLSTIVGFAWTTTNPVSPDKGGGVV